MLPALAPLSALEARLGLDENTLAGAEKTRALAALDDASALVREEARRTFINPTSGMVEAQDAVVRVVLGAAQRNYTNPDAEIKSQAGPFERTLKAAETGVYLTEPELEIVRRYRQVTRQLWTLRTTKSGPDCDTLWVRDQYGCDPFPIGSVSEPWR